MGARRMVTTAAVALIAMAGPGPQTPRWRPPPAAASASAPALPGAALQAALQEWLAGQPAVGSVAAAVAAVGSDGPAWVGEAHSGPPLLHAADEYGVLSITKTFTEALVLREVAAGRIALDGPVPGDPLITPRMLLQHTSGLVNYLEAVGYDPTRPITPEEIVSLGLHSPRLSPPGSEAHYSNTNFHWLGLLLEEVTGRGYGDLVGELAATVGLPHTRLDPAGRPGWVGYASGGIRSTVGDLARWGAALFTPGRVLPAAELAELTTVGPAGVALGLWPQCPCTTGPDGTRHQAGLRQTVVHGGFFFYPDLGLVVVVHFEPSGAPGVDPGTIAGALSNAVGAVRAG